MSVRAFCCIWTEPPPNGVVSPKGRENDGAAALLNIKCVSTSVLAWNQSGIRARLHTGRCWCSVTQYSQGLSLRIGSRTRIALIILAAIIAIIALATLLFQTGPVRHYALAQIRDAAHRYGIEFGNARLGYNVFDLTIVLDNVVVRSRETPDLPPAAVIARVMLNMDLAALIRRREYVIQRLSLVNPALHFVISEDGENNVAAILPGRGKTGGANVSLSEIAARSGSLVFEDRRRGLTITLPQWSASANRQRSGETAIRLNARGDGRLVSGSRTLPLRSVTMQATASSQAMNVHELDIEAAGASVRGAGTVGLADPLPVDLNVSGTAEPGTVLPLLGIKRAISGPLRIRGKMTGPLAKPVIDGTVEGNGLRVEEVKGVDLTTQAVYDISASRIRLPSFTVRMPGGASTGDAIVALTSSAGRSTLNARLQNLDMRVVSALAGAPYSVASVANGTVTASWPSLTISDAVGKADLKLAAMPVPPRPKVLPLTADLIVSFRGRNLVLDIRSFQTLGSTGDGRITIDNSRNLGGTIHAHVADLGPTLNNLEALLGRRVGLPSIAGQSRVTLQLSGTVKQPVIDFELTSPGVGVSTDEEKPAPARTPQPPALPRLPLPRLPPFVRPPGSAALHTPDLPWWGGPSPGGLPARPAPAIQFTERRAEPRPSGSVHLEFPPASAAPGGRLPLAFIRVIDPVIVSRLAAMLQQPPPPAGESPQGGIVIRGRIQLGGRQPQVQAETNVQGQPLSVLLELAGVPNLPVAGDVSAKGKISGTGDQLRGSITISVPNFRLHGETLGALTARVDLAGNEVRVPEFRIAGGPPGRTPGVIEGNLVYNRATTAIHFDVRADKYEIAQLTLPGSVPVGGTFTLFARGSGTPANLNINGRLEAPDLRIAGREYGHIRADVDAAGQVANVKLAAPGLALTADARIGTQAPYPAEFTAVMNGTPVAALPIAFPEGLTGAVTATITGNVPLAEWRKGEATARVENADLTWGRTPLRIAEPPLVATYSNGLLEVKPVTIIAGDTRISAAGTLALERTAPPGELGLQIHADLRALTAALPPERGVSACGILDVNVVLRGRFDALDPTGTIKITGGCYEPPGGVPPITDLTLAAGLQNGLLNIETLAATWAGGRIQAQGRIPLGIIPVQLPFHIPAAAGPAEFALDVTDLNLREAPRLPETVGGVVSMRVKAQAPRPDLNAVTATVTFTKMQLDLAGVPFEQTAQSTIAVGNGVARFTRFSLKGPETSVEISGTAALMPPRKLDLTFQGAANAALISLVTDAIRARGDMNLKLAVTGTLENPSLNGAVDLNGVQMAIQTPGIQVYDLGGRIDIAGNRINVEQLNANVNGGTLNVSGGLAYAGGEFRNVDLTFALKEVYLDYPQGLRTISNAVLRLTREQRGLALGGSAAILEGTYREPMTLERLVALSRLGKDTLLDTGLPPLLAGMRLNINLETQSPVVVDNELARIAVAANVRFVGTVQRPALLGSIVLEEGGELYLAQQTYVIERGVIQFTSERRIEPTLDILARTEAANFDIALALTGTPAHLDARFTSEPPLPEPDIISVLLTGRTLEEGGSETTALQAQALSYLGGQIGGTLGRGAQQVLGLTRVRLDPSLIAPDKDPNARLTLGEQLTRNLEVIYSMDLTNSSDQIWIGKYRLTRRFLSRAVRQEDNTYRFEFRNATEFGGGSREQPLFGERKRPKITGVTFRGNRFFTDKKLREVLDLKPGKRYEFFEVYDRLEKLRNFYAENDFLEARIRMQRSVTNDEWNLVFAIDPGPKVQFVFEGWPASGSLKKQVRQTWREGVFDVQRLQDATAQVQAALVAAGYVNADITPEIVTPEPNLKRVVFVIRPGERYGDVKTVFEGNSKIHSGDLESAIDRERLKTAVFTEPSRVVDVLNRYYRDNGFLDAKVALPNYVFDPTRSRARAIFPITEGPQYHVGRLSFSGNKAIPESVLRHAIPVESGDIYVPQVRDVATTLIEDEYARRGYTDMELTYSLEKEPAAGIVNIVFDISEGRQRIVRDIAITGTDVTSRSFVRGQLRLEPGKPLNTEDLVKSRANLYRTGAYWLVDAQPEPMDGTAADGALTRPVPVRLNVKVSEIQPFSLRYGGFFDTERGPGAILDFANRNSLGSARVLGLRAQYDSEVREARLYFTQPATLAFPLDTAAVGYATREAIDDLITERLGFSINEESRFLDNNVLSFGYRIEQTRSFFQAPNPAAGPVERLRVAPLTATFINETRDNFLNPTRGRFTSHALEYGAGFLGSQVELLKYFGQYVQYFPLDRGVPLRLAPASYRPRWIYATAIRLGVAGGLSGQQLVASERFFAGGATSVRGFKQNSLGPVDEYGNPIGGAAMLIVNNELRFPLYRVLDGAVFLDAGNVYRTVSDLDPLDLRYGAGVGLRVNTRYVLLRFDMGVNLFPKPGESRVRFYFSVGQAF